MGSKTPHTGLGGEEVDRSVPWPDPAVMFTIC